MNEYEQEREFLRSYRQAQKEKEAQMSPDDPNHPANKPRIQYVFNVKMPEHPGNNPTILRNDMGARRNFEATPHNAQA